MSYFSECKNFLREYVQNFHDTGAVLPSSRFLARAMVSELRKPHGPCRILEVGPGTGPVTREILRLMGPEDRLDAVELNGRFVAFLQQRFEQNEEFRQKRSQVTIMQAGVEEVPGEAVYDFIISGLPHNNFSIAQIRSIFQTYFRLLKPAGILTYFEYMWIRRLKTPLVKRPERRRLYRLGRVVGKYLDAYQIRHDNVFVNVPPAVVRHLKMRGE